MPPSFISNHFVTIIIHIGIVLFSSDYYHDDTTPSRALCVCGYGLNDNAGPRLQLLLRLQLQPHLTIPCQPTFESYIIIRRHQSKVYSTRLCYCCCCYLCYLPPPAGHVGYIQGPPLFTQPPSRCGVPYAQANTEIGFPSRSLANTHEIYLIDPHIDPVITI